MPDRFALSFEPRPGDFSVRMRRQDAWTIGDRRGRRYRGRFAVLAVALAMPAVAAPVDWVRARPPSETGRAGTAPEAAAGSPLAGEEGDFSGPAAENEALWATLREPDRPLLPVDDGSVAQSLHVGTGGQDRSRALQCLAAAIYYEARSEPDAGQRAVAQVVLNRVAHPAYPDTVCGVVYQGSERSTGCQFTFTCDGSLARAPRPLVWQRAEAVARAALSGFVYRPVGLATHYHTTAVNPYWAPSLAYLGTIGTHRFYSLRGRAGQPAIFRFAYTGGEPVAAPHPRRLEDARPGDELSVPDPLQLQLAYDREMGITHADIHPSEAGVPGSRAPGSKAPGSKAPGSKAPDSTALDRDLLNSGSVQPEFARSGSWIAAPTVMSGQAR